MARIIDAALTSDNGCDVSAVHGTWGRLDAAGRRGLAFTPEVKAETDRLYERVAHVVPAIEWPAYAPLIAAINKLKRQKNAVILAHNYMTSEIFYCVGDFRGNDFICRLPPVVIGNNASRVQRLEVCQRLIQLGVR